MRRTEFLEELERLLADLPEEERKAAIQYYDDYLQDAGQENEQEVISGFSAERLEAECGAGQLVLEGGASEKAKLECGAGEVIYTVPGVREDYNYEMECDVGEIEIGGDSYSGLGVERKEDNRSPYSIEAECRMGRIEILFR